MTTVPPSRITGWSSPGTTEVTVHQFTLYGYETVCKTQHARANLYGEHRKQTIREYQQAGVPNMELSLYNLENDPHLSPFSRDDVFQTIFERLLNLKF